MRTHNIDFYEDLIKIIKYNQICTLFLLLCSFKPNQSMNNKKEYSETRLI